VLKQEGAGFFGGMFGRTVSAPELDDEEEEEKEEVPPSAVERGRTHVNGFKDLRTKKGSSRGQNLALTG